MSISWITLAQMPKYQYRCHCIFLQSFLLLCNWQWKEKSKKYNYGSPNISSVIHRLLDWVILHNYKPGEKAHLIPNLKTKRKGENCILPIVHNTFIMHPLIALNNRNWRSWGFSFSIHALMFSSEPAASCFPFSYTSGDSSHSRNQRPGKQSWAFS